MKVAFELKEDVNQVEIAVQGSDAHLVVTPAGYSTADALEIAALDENPHVKRASKSSGGGEK
jgi:virulence-associated protein VagC